MRYIIALVDFSAVTDAVVKLAAEIAPALRAKLILLHVATPDADYEGTRMRTDLSRRGVAGEMHHYHRVLQELETDCQSAGIDVTALLVRGTSARGSPTRKILKEIARVKPGLVVVGSHGHGPLHDVLLGSITSAVVHKSPCPVLVVPSPKHLQREKRQTAK